jgi:hypothetical protein
VAPALLIIGGAAIDAGVGPAVVALAERTRTGVLNTFTAKGLFAYDHPAHLGTIGLQRDDVALAGVADAVADGVTVVVCGADELTGQLPGGVVAVAPGDLGSFNPDPVDQWRPRPRLYGELAAVCGPGYADDRVPLAPIRAAGDLSAWLRYGAVVVAGAGLVGFWLGRTFPTRRFGSVVLPATADDTFVQRRTVDAVDAGRLVVAVIGPDDPEPSGPAVVVERWVPDGPVMDPSARIAALDAAVAAGGGLVTVAVDIGDLGQLEAVAGPVVAWGGVR